MICHKLGRGSADPPAPSVLTALQQTPCMQQTLCNFRVMVNFMYSLMQKNGYTFATVYNSKCVSVFLHQTILVRLAYQRELNFLVLSGLICSSIVTNQSQYLTIGNQLNYTAL